MWDENNNFVWERAVAIALVIASGIVSVFTVTAVFGMILGYL